VLRSSGGSRKSREFSAFCAVLVVVSVSLSDIGEACLHVDSIVVVSL
jgi:hypothetical protein